MKITFSVEIDTKDEAKAKEIAETWCSIENLGDSINGYNLSNFKVETVESRDYGVILWDRRNNTHTVVSVDLTFTESKEQALKLRRQRMPAFNMSHTEYRNHFGQEIRIT